MQRAVIAGERASVEHRRGRVQPLSGELRGLRGRPDRVPDGVTRVPERIEQPFGERTHRIRIRAIVQHQQVDV